MATCVLRVIAAVSAMLFAFILIQNPTANAEDLLDSTSPTNTGADRESYELGTIFTTTANGTITVVRFYAINGEAGRHTARLWNNTSGTVAGGPYTFCAGGTGWRAYVLPTPVDVTAGTPYTVSVTTGHDTLKRYAYTPAGFAATAENIWGAATGSAGNDQSVLNEHGTIFSSTVAGQVTGVRVYAVAGESGDHTVRIWNNATGLVISGPHTFTYAGTGWREFTLPVPLDIQAGTAYTVSVSTGTDATHLFAYIDYALSSGGSNGNHLNYPASAGVYPSTLGDRPTLTYQNQNYLRTVIFSAGGGGNGLSLTFPTNAGVFTNSLGARPTSSSGSRNYFKDITFIPSGQPPVSELPTVAGCTMFTVDDEWNRDVSGLPVHTAWDNYFNSHWGTQTINVVYGEFKNDDSGVPYNVVPADQPMLPITIRWPAEWGPSQSDSGPWPFPGPTKVAIQTGNPGCPTWTDCHILVAQQGTCKLYEGYGCYFDDAIGRYNCVAGAIFDLTRNSYGQRPEGWTSTDAAGLPFIPGLIRYEEVATGEIKHALRFQTSYASWNWIKPASHGALPTGAPGDGPPFGTRIRLKASFNISGYSARNQVILTALKRYGAILADGNYPNTNYVFQADHHTGWADDGLDQLWNIPNSAFEVLQTYQ